MPFEQLYNYAPTPLHTTYQQLKDHIYRRAEKLFAKNREERDAIKNIEQLKLYNIEKRAKFLEAIGGIPFDGTPLNAKVTNTIARDDYKIESIIFNSRKDTYVTGSLYIPNGLTKKTPAVLFVCGHSAEGRLYAEYQRVCDTICRAGLVVFAIDPVGQGERSEYYDAESDTYLIQRATADHDQAGLPGLASGAACARYFLLDEMRAIDYLQTRPEVDPDKIGITGNSGGGTQSLVSAGIDDRIVAAAPGTFITSRESYMYVGQSQDAEQIWPSATLYGYDHISPIMHFAPKPFAILAVKYDFFTIDGTYDTYEEAKRFYEMYGAKDSLRLYEDDYLHCYTPKLARDAAAFFSLYLLGEEKHIDNSSYEPLPEEALYATPSGHVMGDIPNAKFMRDDVRELADAQEAARLALPQPERKAQAKAWLEKQIYSYRTPHKLNYRKTDGLTGEEGGYCCTGAMWRSQADLFGFAQIFTTAKFCDDDVLPLYFIVWDDGNVTFQQRYREVYAKCDEGYRVVVADLPGIGYLKQQTLRDEPYTTTYGTLYKLANDLTFIGDSMAALRAYDLTRTIEAVTEKYSSTGKITLYGDGKAGTTALVCAFISGKYKFEAGKDLALDYKKEEMYNDLRKYNDDLGRVFPGMLRYFDYRELYDSLSE